MAIPYSRTIIGNLPWYSVLVVSGIALAIWLAGREEKRLGLPKDTVIDFTLLAVPCGIVGARLYYVLMAWEQFAANPLSALYVWQGGLAIYGGVIGGAVGVWIYSRRKKISFGTLSDIIAPGLILAQAVGRWGNYFNMEAYGPQITDPRLQFFPFGVQIPENGVYVWHMATFFYESTWNLLGFAVLWMLRKRKARPGHLFAWYLVIYGSGRFLIEQLRQDSLYIGSLRASQWLSLLLCAAAAVLLLAQKRNQTRRRLGLGLFCTALWLMRWAFQAQMGWVCLLIAAAGVMAIWLLRGKRTLALLLGVLALDTAGAVLGLFAGANLLSSFVCSLTLPGYLIALYDEQA